MFRKFIPSPNPCEVVVRLAILVLSGASVGQLYAQGSPASGPLNALPLAMSTSMTLAIESHARADSSSKDAGTWQISRHRTDWHGAEAVLTVSIFRRPNGEATVVDSVLSLATGIAPVSERSHQTGRLLAIEFSPDRSTVIVTREDTAHHTQQFALDRAVMNSTDTPLAVQSMPLAVGTQYIVPEFDVDRGGVIHDTLTVVEQETLRFRGESLATFHVRSSSGPTIWDWWVSPLDRRLIRVTRTPRDSGNILVMTLRRTDQSGRDPGHRDEP